MTDQDKPGTDWASKHANAGTNREQHPNYTTADGPVNPRPDTVDTDQFLNMINGE